MPSVDRPFDVRQADIVSCRRCPRLVEWRERVAREKRAAFREEEYWGRPVPDFGDPNATRLIVGLAPAAHGANRTGRMFTGDRSGDFLFAALHRAGIASQPTSVHAGDGLTLTDCLITAAVHCAPPDNKPLPSEIANCAGYLAELLLGGRFRSVLCLGGLAWDRVLPILDVRAKFGHGAVVETVGVRVVGCYHPSQQNTFTGRLTPPMIDAAMAEWARAR